MMSELDLVQKISVIAVPLIFAMTVHEAAHALVAKKLGDDSADKLGRVTLNPINHIDLVGTIIVPIVMLLTLPFILGWAKPVPVTWDKLNHPRRDMGLVALAGPLANLVMAVLWALLILLCQKLPESYIWVTLPLMYMGAFGVFINGIVMVLNLLPILPLDGGRILTSVLPPDLAKKYAMLEPYGLYILVALLVTEMLSRLIWPPLLIFIDSLQVGSVVFSLLS